MLTLSRPPGLPTRDVADLLAVSAKYKALGKLWVSLPQGKAAQLVRAVLARDLAYDGEVMESTDAANLASGFITHVGDAAEFFTNGSWCDAPVVTSTVTRGASWEPLSGATFDAGVVGVGDDRAAMLWVEDED
jgi:hypothetical protein